MLVAQSCPTLQPHRLRLTRVLYPQDSPGKNTRIGCHSLWDHNHSGILAWLPENSLPRYPTGTMKSTCPNSSPNLFLLYSVFSESASWVWDPCSEGPMLCLMVSSLVAQMVKRLPVMQETWVQSLVQEDPLEKEMATHSSTLAWKIPWTEKPGRLQSMRLQRVGHN